MQEDYELKIDFMYPAVCKEPKVLFKFKDGQVMDSQFALSTNRVNFKDKNVLKLPKDKEVKIPLYGTMKFSEAVKKELIKLSSLAYDTLVLSSRVYWEFHDKKQNKKNK